MAKPTTASWSKLSFWLGDANSPEDFTQAVCGLATKNFAITAQTSDQNVPDCDDPDLPAWTERVVRAMSAGWDANGVLATEAYEKYRTWMLSAEARNAYVVLELPGAAAGYYSGRFVMTNLQHGAALDNGKITVSMNIQSDGPVVWNAGAPA